MNVRIVVVWAFLIAAGSAPAASAQTASVKESPLARVRSALLHYDLSPQGTLALLPQLAELARTSKGSEAGEAAFLRAAAARDLLFLADYLPDESLRVGLAAQLGVAPEALASAIQVELQAAAKGVYRAPALAAIAELQRTATGAEPPQPPFEVGRDAMFLRAVAAMTNDPIAFARFASQTADPCPKPESCAAPYVEFETEGRRALAYLQQLSAAAVRLSRARGQGDPLAEAVAATADRDFARVRALSIRVPPRLPEGRALTLPGGATTWPAPDILVFVSPTELKHALAPRVRAGIDGNVERVAEAGPMYPATSALTLSSADTSPPTKAIEPFVEAVRLLRGEQTEFRAALVADAAVPSQFVARALVSLRKAGVPQLVLASRSQDGTLFGAPIRVVLPTVDKPGATPDLKLRVRLGGYSLDVGRGVVDIPRVRDETGFHFDLAALRTAAAKRAPKSAAVSFMSDVATEQVLHAVFNVTPARAPVDLVIQ
jgi:hypothetical protein